MFEVGRLVARISLEGAATFSRDVKAIGSEFTGLSQQGQTAAREVGTGMVTLGAGITALAGLAITKFAQFDKAMSEVKAVTGATADEQNRLRQAALDAGAVTVYTAEEAAKAQANLGRAGVSTTNILNGGLTGALALAAAGQMDVGEAAEIAATAMTQFRLSGEAIPHLADLLAAGANKAQGGVQDLGFALKQSGLVAAQMGLSVEDTIGTLTAFASAGLIGSDAGTSFRTMLLALATPTKQQTALMKEYNIQAYDQQGNFVGTTRLAAQLQEGFKGVDQAQRDYALGVIFGSDAIRAANVLYNEGADGIREWTNAVNETGAAADVASTMQNNLAGDIEKLGGALDTALIETGEGANGILRDMVQLVTSLVDGYSELPDWVQSGALALGIFTGAALLLGGILLIGIGQLANFRQNIKYLSTEMPVATARVKGMLSVLGGPWGIALSAATAILGLLIQSTADAQARTEAYGTTLDETTHKVTASTREMTKANLAAKDSFLWIESDSAYDAAEKLGLSLDTVTDAAMGNVTALKAVRDAMDIGKLGTDEYNDGLARTGLTAGEYALAVGKVEEAIRGESGSLDEAIRVAQQKASVDGDTKDANAKVADSYKDVDEAVDGVVTSLSDLYAEIEKVNGLTLDARAANREYEGAVDDLSAAVQEQRDAYEEANGTLDGFVFSMDAGTEAGRRGQAALDDVAKSAWANADAIAANGGSVDDYKAALVAGRDAVLTAIHDAGIYDQAANDLADSIIRIPTDKEVRLAVETAAATNAVNGWITRFDGTRIRVFVDANAGTSYRIEGSTLSFRANGGIEHFAGGGLREQHVAQIARAGKTRIWNEPETEGEGYVPLAMSKRARSTEVLGEIADLFGYDLVKRGSDAPAPSSAPQRTAEKAGKTVNIHLHNAVFGKDPVEQIREGSDLATAALDV